RQTIQISVNLLTNSGDAPGRCEGAVEWDSLENLTEFKLVFNERAWDFPMGREEWGGQNRPCSRNYEDKIEN
ncbi:MAG TPA: hypothetical protein PKH31_17295, partial [Candidatus Sumerlaeota bacterium]|nr:hypothetical protein [Candidatus Sumerlaeota bacterium]